MVKGFYEVSGHATIEVGLQLRTIRTHCGSNATARPVAPPLPKSLVSANGAQILQCSTHLQVLPSFRKKT
jgi:hypothetical protein